MFPQSNHNFHLKLLAEPSQFPSTVSLHKHERVLHYIKCTLINKGDNVTYKCNIGGRSCNHCYSSGKAISITYSECVTLALRIHHAKRMCLIIIVIRDLSGCTTYFFTLSRTQHDLKQNFFDMKCVLWLSVHILSEIFLILRRIERDISINIQRY
jgi:hypothetical protein